MPAEYDRLARPYRRSKATPFRVYSEIPDHLALLGDLRGRSVLDLACGEGFYTRLIKQAGANRVVGVDLSENMIAWAREQEAAAPLGITYVCGPAESLGPVGPFDVVSAAFLLNCAPDRPTLDAMARAVMMNLEPGGRMVMTVSSVDEYPGTDYSPYGMVDDVREALVDGTPYRITFLLDEDTFTLVNYAHAHSTYEEALRAAGLADIRWHSPRITAEGLAAYPPGFWDTYLARPPMMRISAVRPRAWENSSRLGAEDESIALLAVGEFLVDLGFHVLQRDSAGARRPLIKEALEGLAPAKHLDLRVEIVCEREEEFLPVRRQQ